MNDKILGATGFVVALFIYIYYTAWAILTPFVDPKVTWFHALFPDRWWAFAIPTALLVVGLTGIAVFIGAVSMKGR